jgi:hypothetical protein
LRTLVPIRLRQANLQLSKQAAQPSMAVIGPNVNAADRIASGTTSTQEQRFILTLTTTATTTFMDIVMLTATNSSIGKSLRRQVEMFLLPQSSRGEGSVGSGMGITLGWQLILIATAMPLSGMGHTPKSHPQVAALMAPGPLQQEM